MFVNIKAFGQWLVQPKSEPSEADRAQQAALGGGFEVARDKLEREQKKRLALRLVNARSTRVRQDKECKEVGRSKKRSGA